jgi:glycosyltransferase involved in cell wall biosynthesis
VLSVIRNLINYVNDPVFEHHIIYTIDKKRYPFKAPYIPGIASEKTFYYSAHWNFYITSARLAELIPDDESILIANDWLELGMVSNLGLAHKVIQIVHGDYEYYYQLAGKHEAWVDAFVTVAQNIKDKLDLALPDRKKDIHYLRFPVPASECTQSKPEHEINIIFAGRSSREKGFHLLPEIIRGVQKKSRKVNWHFAGFDNHNSLEQLNHQANMYSYGILSNADLNKIFCRMHILILPSFSEGMPLSVIEAMKAGVVPVANQIPGGINELITDGNNGYLIQGNSPEAFAAKINSLTENQNLLEQMSAKSKELADTLFDPLKNAKAYADLFLKVSETEFRLKPARKIYGSRLDQPWIPNLVTAAIRSLS